MVKRTVAVTLIDKEDVIDLADAVDYVRRAIDYYQDQQHMDAYMVRISKEELSQQAANNPSAEICEWKVNMDWGNPVSIKTQCGIWRSLDKPHLESYNFCPYCGRSRKLSHVG